MEKTKEKTKEKTFEQILFDCLYDLMRDSYVQLSPKKLEKLKLKCDLSALQLKKYLHGFLQKSHNEMIQNMRNVIKEISKDIIAFDERLKKLEGNKD